MKLYATITSERATKGQGGNEYITIGLYDKNETNIGYIKMLPDENGHHLPYIRVEILGRIQYNSIPELKGKKQNKNITERLDYLRKELQAERISYGELAELQGLAPYIDKNDVELLEAAGVPEEEYTKGKKQKGKHDCGVCAYCARNS